MDRDRIPFPTCRRCNCLMFPENYEIGYCGICQIKNKEDEDTQLINIERDPITAEIYEFIRNRFPDKVNEIEIRWKENKERCGMFSLKDLGLRSDKK